MASKDLVPGREAGPVHTGRFLHAIRDLGRRGASEPEGAVEIHCCPGQGVARILAFLAAQGQAHHDGAHSVGNHRVPRSSSFWLVYPEATESHSASSKPLEVVVVQPPRIWVPPTETAGLAPAAAKRPHWTVEDCRLTTDEFDRLAAASGFPTGELREHLMSESSRWLLLVELGLWGWTSGGWDPADPLEDCPGVSEFCRYRLGPALAALPETELAGATGVLPPIALSGRGHHLEDLASASQRPGSLSSDRSSPHWSLRLLGQPQLARRLADGSWSPVSFSFRRLLDFLGLLASSPRFEVTKEAVLERLWRPDDRHRALKNLHPMASHLRKVLADGDHVALTLEQGVYRIVPADALPVDLTVFREGCEAEADLSAREAAWEVYRGDFMEGHDDSWIVEQREEFREMYMELLDGLGEEYLASNRPQEAEDAYRTLLNQDPLQEHIYLKIMTLYRDRGRRDLVRRLYERMSRIFQRELGISPLESTVEAYDRLMA